MTIRARSAVLAAAALAVFGAPAVMSTAAAATSGPLAFSATWTGSVKVNLPATFVFDGTGTSNVMGPIHAHGPARVTGISFTCLAGLANVNVQTIEAADGTLTLTSQDVGCPTGLGTFHGTGVYTVTGGTGRYAGATGSGTLDGHANILTSTATITAEGTLVLAS